MAAPAADAGDPPAPRPPSLVMRLERLGAAFQTRLSFMRSLLRRMAREGWRIERRRFDIDADGYGTAVYTVDTPARRYGFVGFTQPLDPAMRTDRVIAEAWDAAFVLYDGEPAPEEITRLRDNAPRQEAGRYAATDLVLSRANRSVRLFEHVAASLAAGHQPDPALLVSTGYLMRTTAVYGNGKFGLADRARYADRPELDEPFRAEMLTVYLIRAFTFDLVEHVARARGGERAVALDPGLKRMLGIGNATGLGMAPFLVSHPELIHNWFGAREAALARVRALDQATPAAAARFRALAARARAHVAEWRVEDNRQSAAIARLEVELDTLAGWLAATPGPLAAPRPWDGLWRRAEAAFSVEGQELLLSLLLEPHGNLVDDLAEGLAVAVEQRLDPAMTVPALKRLIETHYGWALTIDFADPAADSHVWYYSEEKLEPRRGERRAEIGPAQEMAVAVARDVAALHAAILRHGDDSLPSLLLRRPDLRHAARRVQAAATRPYAEIRDNLTGAGCRPVDLLRGKLAFFGAGKFDPKSELWTRITMYQGAPAPAELSVAAAEDWAFPALAAPPPWAG